jgi:hypothetical protein
VLAVESLETLRTFATEGAAFSLPQPEDTPLKPPAEVERLHGTPPRPVSA